MRRSAWLLPPLALIAAGCIPAPRAAPPPPRQVRAPARPGAVERAGRDAVARNEAARDEAARDEAARDEASPDELARNEPLRDEPPRDDVARDGARGDEAAREDATPDGGSAARGDGRAADGASSPDDARDETARRGPVTPAQVARPRSAWVARGVTADAAEVAASVYVVRRGDTLRAIAERTGASSEGIARANGIAAPFTVRTGQRLSIPGGRYHLVRPGQSGIAIARAYGVPWERIVAENALEEPYILRAGQRLLLPPRAAPGASTLEERAAAFQLDIDDLITGSEPALARNAAPAPPVRSARQAVPATVPVAQPGRFAGRFDWPLTGPLLDRFGPLGGGRVNEGIDIAADAGTPIRAAADGVVAYVGSEIAVFGGLILIKHGGGWITTYGHAQELLVTRGQQVRRGQVIARAGETGSATEPMLHFEIRQGRKPVNPLGYLPRRS